MNAPRVNGQDAPAIHVTTQTIGSDDVQAVDARELHHYLEARRDFTNWIKARIAQYQFEEGTDYITTLAKIGERSNVRRHDYTLTLDMAKELAMVERNERGRQARRYFIECERLLRQRAPATPEPIDHFRLLATYNRGELQSVTHLPYTAAVVCTDNPDELRALIISARPELLPAIADALAMRIKQTTDSLRRNKP